MIDFEVFERDWLVVIINPVHKTETVIINDPKKLEDYYNHHKNEIWVGFNSRHYDQYILKSIMCGLNPKKCNDHIIVKKQDGYRFSSLLNKIQLINFDIMPNPPVSLKTLEAFMGNNIKESDVPFDIDRPLTREEIEETVKYCRTDVEQTVEVFLQRKNEFDSQMALIKEFQLPLSYIGKTQAQLAAIILEASRVKFDDGWNIRIPETLNLEKYQFVADWFLNKENHSDDKKLQTDIAGVPHIFAWGGVHGAIPKYHYTARDDEYLIMIDVDQLYPTIMIKYHLLSRAVKEPEKFKDILETSLRLKAEGKKKEREPYKRICNITYGSEGDPFNAMYDPLHRRLVCVFGQLLIIDLIEKLESFCKLIQLGKNGCIKTH